MYLISQSCSSFTYSCNSISCNSFFKNLHLQFPGDLSITHLSSYQFAHSGGRREVSWFQTWPGHCVSPPGGINEYNPTVNITWRKALGRCREICNRMARASMFFFLNPTQSGQINKDIKKFIPRFFSFLQTLIHKYVYTLNPNTSIHILNTLLFTFLLVLTTRICVTIKAS